MKIENYMSCQFLHLTKKLRIFLDFDCTFDSMNQSWNKAYNNDVIKHILICIESRIKYLIVRKIIMKEDFEFSITYI